MAHTCKILPIDHVASVRKLLEIANKNKIQNTVPVLLKKGNVRRKDTNTATICVYYTIYIANDSQNNSIA